MIFCIGCDFSYIENRDNFTFILRCTNVTNTGLMMPATTLLQGKKKKKAPSATKNALS